ncbi:hypothetical protein KKA14_04645, partial [bacterium]|nr:hypothetical protein [bacterium]
MFSHRFFHYYFYSWIAFLGGVSIFAEKKPVFWDVMSQTDVSAQYKLQIPLFRYFIEPFAGTTFSLLSRDAIWFGVATLIYLICRSSWMLALASPQSIGIRKRVVMAYLRNVFSFHCVSFFLIISGIIIFLLVAVHFRGIAFGSRYVLIIALRGLYLSAFLFLIKALINFLLFFSPNQPPLKLKNSSKKRIWFFQFPKDLFQELFYYFS